VIHKPRLFFKSSSPKFYQKGAVVILMAFIIGLGATAYLLKAFNASNLQAEQDKKTYQTLSEAKSALIAWAVSHPNVPGMMPWPDRNTDLDFEGDNAYDGKSDCVTTAFQSSYLLGQLPWRAQSNPCVTPHTGLGSDFRDGQGNHLWYAVSRNLVYDYENAQAPVINPGMINPPHAITPYLRQGGTESYPWLRVLDRNGNLISDRVAAVIIAPGNPIGGQNRSASAPNANEFLDSFKIGAANYKNSDAALVDEDFIMGDDSRNVSINDPTFVQPYHFNDKLVYITIDELMTALEKRVGEEVRNALKRYHDANGYYPFAAKLGSTKFYACETNNQTGVLPVTNTAPTSVTCSHTRAGLNVTANCGANGFNEVVSIFFRKTLTNFTASNGACTFSGRDCICIGAGRCTRGAQIFQCDANANCDTAGTTSGEIRFIGGEFDATTMLGTCNAPTAGDTCQISAVDVRCTGIGAGSVTRNVCTDTVFNAGTSQLPAWIMNNRWQDYVFYELTRPTNMAGISVGNKVVGAIIATAGRPINSAPFSVKGSPQVRPSCDVSDYLDSARNVSSDSDYEPTSTLGSNNYNDQTFVVEP